MQLRQQRGSEEPGECITDVDLLITEALDFMIAVDEIDFEVAAIIDGVKEMYENISK